MDRYTRYNDPYAQYWAGFPQGFRGNVTQPNPWAMALQSGLQAIPQAISQGMDWANMWQQMKARQEELQFLPIKRGMEFAETMGTDYQPTAQAGQLIEKLTGTQLPKTYEFQKEEGPAREISKEDYESRFQQKGYAPIVPFKKQQLKASTDIKEMMLGLKEATLAAQIQSANDKYEILKQNSENAQYNAETRRIFTEQMGNYRQQIADYKQQLADIQGAKGPKTLEEGALTGDKNAIGLLREKWAASHPNTAADKEGRDLLKSALDTHRTNLTMIEKNYTGMLGMINDPAKRAPIEARMQADIGKERLRHAQEVLDLELGSPKYRANVQKVRDELVKSLFPEIPKTGAENPSKEKPQDKTPSSRPAPSVGFTPFVNPSVGGGLPNMGLPQGPDWLSGILESLRLSKPRNGQGQGMPRPQQQFNPMLIPGYPRL